MNSHEILETDRGIQHYFYNSTNWYALNCINNKDLEKTSPNEN